MRRTEGRTGRSRLMFLALVAVQSILALSARVEAAGAESAMSVPYAKARAAFNTKLTRRGPSPQPGAPSPAPVKADKIQYRSGDLTLTAFVSPSPRDHKKHPAVLFLHGGFAFDVDDWEMVRPFLDAGFVVMTPLLRGENGQPGAFSAFYDEVDDVVAATERLAHLPQVDARNLFVAGHSAGGTLTLLTAMATQRFRAAAAFSGAPDARALVRGMPALLVFDGSDPREFQLRSPLAFATSFLCPTRLFYGSQETFFAASTVETARRAQERKLDVAAVVVPGDHFTSLPRAMSQAIEFFQGMSGRAPTLTKTSLP
jgi:dipeptidyl aminopeptidase/acylaminoacyl peptidase